MPEMSLEKIDEIIERPIARHRLNNLHSSIVMNLSFSDSLNHIYISKEKQTDTRNSLTLSMFVEFVAHVHE